MSANINVNLPEVVQSNDSSTQLEIVGFNITLDPVNNPDQWPFKPSSDGTCPHASDCSVAVYADTVTIVGDLVNPGQDISIYARELIVGPTTYINTSAPDPETNYTIYKQPPNNNPQPGSNGPNGANGSSNTPAGNINLAVGTISVNGTDQGAGTPARLLSQSQALLSTFEELWVAGSPIFDKFNNLNIGAINFSFETKIQWTFEIDLYWTVTMSNTSLSNAQVVAAATRTVNSQTQLVLDLSFGLIQLTSSNTSVTLNGHPFTSGSIEIEFALNTQLIFNIDSNGTGISCDTNSTWSVQDVQVLIYDPNQPFNMKSYMCTGADTIPSVISTLNSTAGPVLDAAVIALGAAIAEAYIASYQFGTPGIVLMANGGVGGRGQDGGAGVPASSGAGGNGGNGGTTGNGSNGGNIRFFVANEPTTGVAAISAPGLGAIVPLPGTSTYGQIGKSGTPGTNGSAGNVQLNGKPFSQAFEPVNYGDFAGEVVIGQLNMELQGAKLAFISAEVPNDSAKTIANYQDVIVLYNWLQSLTAPFANQTSPADYANRAGIYQATQVALGRLQAGLSYYGTPINWTPALTVEKLQSNTTTLTQMASDIWNYYLIASAENATQQTQLAQANNAMAHLTTDIANLVTQLSDIQTKQITPLATSLVNLDAKVTQTITNVFNEMTSDQQNQVIGLFGTGCSLDDIKKGLTGVISVAKGIASAETDIIAAAKSIGEGVADIVGASQDAIKNLQTAAQDWASLQTAWQTLVADLNSNAVNNGAIAIDEQTFDSLLNQFFGTANFTAQLETDVNNMVTLAQARNQARISLTTFCAQAASLTAEIAQKQAYQQYMQAVIAGKQKPNLTDSVSFLLNIYNNMANEVVDNLWMTNQAYSYWSLSPTTLEIDSLDSGELDSQMGALATSVQKAQQGFGTPPSKYNNLSYTFTKDNNPEVMAQLVSNQVVRLTLSPDDAQNPFADDSFVIVSSMSISLGGLPAKWPENSALTVAIGQTGPDTRIDQYDNPIDPVVMVFSHDPISQTYSYDLYAKKVTITPSFGDQSTYTGISPFSPWVLDFTHSKMGNFDWSTVTSITISFQGTLRGPKPSHIASAAKDEALAEPA